MKKKNRYRNPRAQVGTAGLTDPLTRLWMWRTVSAIGMKRLAPRNLDSLDDDILHACGLLHRLRDEGSPKLTHAEAERVVRERVRAAPIPARRGVLHRNVERLGRLLALDALERDLLTYLVRLATCQPFRALAEAMNNSAEVERVLAIALQATPARIHAVLRPESTLVGSGLLGPKGCVDMYEEPIEMLDGLTSALLERHTSDASLLRRFFRRAPAGTLELKAYGHVGDGVDIAHALLASAATGGQRGLNVLLHGPAGTGKTELARALARATGHLLYEVAVEDSNGQPADRSDRLAAWQLCRAVVQHIDGAMIVFDEAEDVFPQATSFMGFGSASPSNKGWINRMLESSGAPTVWITNAADAIDPAFLRRFDLVLGVRGPRQEARRVFVARSTAGLGLSDDVREELAADERLSPALIERVASLARTTAAVLPALATTKKTGVKGARVEGAPAEGIPTNADRVVRAVTRGFLDVLSPQGRPARRKPPFTFDASLLNTTPPASDLVAQLLVRREASVLLHGLPGTGKTEFARHLASAAGVPLLAKRASDLLGSYVGQTEKALASMFREAREQGAFLLLDEADTFLRERAGARHSWEVSQVNELLVQMEGFDGVFFCATNHIDDLDAAAFRRFDLKVRCDPLTADGRRRLAVLAFSDLALDVQNEVVAGVEPLDGLCIGDVVAVRRGLLLSAAVSACDVLTRLRDELLRRPHRARIGFASSTTALTPDRR